jgi:hypothetical protein
MDFDADAIINEYGHDVLLRRRLDEVDGKKEHALPKDELYADVLERHTMYRVMQKPDGLSGHPEGLVSDLDVRFYARPGAMLKTGDLLYEETPHERHDYEKWIITRSVPYYIGNELKYFLAYVTRLDPVT